MLPKALTDVAIWPLMAVSCLNIAVGLGLIERREGEGDRARRHEWTKQIFNNYCKQIEKPQGMTYAIVYLPHFILHDAYRSRNRRLRLIMAKRRLQKAWPSHSSGEKA
jgi:hypothetical protein